MNTDIKLSWAAYQRLLNSRSKADRGKANIQLIDLGQKPIAIFFDLAQGGRRVLVKDSLAIRAADDYYLKMRGWGPHSKQAYSLYKNIIVAQLDKNILTPQWQMKRSEAAARLERLKEYGKPQKAVPVQSSSIAAIRPEDLDAAFDAIERPGQVAINLTSMTVVEIIALGEAPLKPARPLPPRLAEIPVINNADLEVIEESAPPVPIKKPQPPAPAPSPVRKPAPPVEPPSPPEKPITDAELIREIIKTGDLLKFNIVSKGPEFRNQLIWGVLQRIEIAKESKDKGGEERLRKLLVAVQSIGSPAPVKPPPVKKPVPPVEKPVAPPAAVEGAMMTAEDAKLSKLIEGALVSNKSIVVELSERGIISGDNIVKRITEMIGELSRKKGKGTLSQAESDKLVRLDALLFVVRKDLNKAKDMLRRLLEKQAELMKKKKPK